MSRRSHIELRYASRGSRHARVIEHKWHSNAVSYVGVHESSAPLKLCKLHGSVNWLRSNTHISGRGMRPATPAKAARHNGRLIGLDTGAIDTPGTREETLQQMRHDAFGARRAAVCALYAVGKPAPSNPSVLNSVRNAATRLFCDSPDSEVTVIGVRPSRDSSDDPILFEIFKSLTCHSAPKTYVGPDTSDRQEAEKFGLLPGAKGLQEWLSNQCV